MADTNEYELTPSGGRSEKMCTTGQEYIEDVDITEIKEEKDDD